MIIILNSKISPTNVQYVDTSLNATQHYYCQA